MDFCTLEGEENVPNALSVVGEVADSATALAGLILVFLGGVFSSYEPYRKSEHHEAKWRHRRRAWFAFGGFVLSLLSAGLALAAKLLDHERTALVALLLLVFALIWVVAVAFWEVIDMR
jgi:peptidoglycan/LPS O-acetylase OafA/YrhL